MRNCSLHTVYGTEMTPEMLAALHGGNTDSPKAKVFLESVEFIHSWGEYSYYSESIRTLSADQYPKRYWGDHYADLVSIKQAWDPEQIFWCPQCVASDAEPRCPKNGTDCILTNNHQPAHTLI